jgi:3-oxoacyl-[acyl-carrier protein] reductase
MDLYGHTALVTGASRGIGQAIALRLGEVGIDVAVGFGHDSKAAEEQAERLRQMGRRAIAVAADLSDPAQVMRMVDRVEAELGSIDILVSNAGIGPRQALEEISLEDWERVMNVNLRPAFLLAQRLTPTMRHRGWGRVILLSSVAAFTGGIIGPHYATSKAALIGLTHALAGPLAPYGVTVNAIAPALIETEMMPAEPEARQRIAERIPVGRLGRAEEVAEVVLSLIANPYITNQTLLVDGGVYPH